MVLAFAERHRDKGPATDVLIDALAHTGRSGLRRRPKLLWFSYQAHGGNAHPKALSHYRLALIGASLEIFQDAANIHDDIVDRSATRRGHTSLATYLSEHHYAEGWLGDPTHFGMALALLVGDIVLLAGDRTFRYAVEDPIDPEQRAFLTRLHEECNSEAALGYFLDAAGPRFPDMPEPDVLVEQAMGVVRTKSARFRVAMPFAMGAAAAGADREACDAMIKCGLLAGEAFQLRDDQLSTTGSPTLTGKPVGGDLQEGKRTALIGLTLQRLSPADRRTFIRALQRGDAPLAEERVLFLQQVIAQSGALEVLEELIQTKVRQATEAIEATNLDPTGKALLEYATVAISSPHQHI